MYIPKIYKIEDREIIEEFIRKNGFATIISSTDSTHVPLDLQVNENGDSVLWGHVSKGNTQWKIFESNPDILAVFLSPVHSYISSSWYNQPNVPTWNYMSVQVSGKAEIIRGDKLWDSLRKLTDKYEKESENPVSLDTMPESVQKQMNGLVGFEITIENMECAFKLSQNRNEEDLLNIIRQLNMKEGINSKLMAEIMEEKVLGDRLPPK